jgi:hypothetical protein
MASPVGREADFRQMIENGTAIAEDIETDARRLAEKMERIHGEKYRVLIDHDVGLISVRAI